MKRTIKPSGSSTPDILILTSVGKKQDTEAFTWPGGQLVRQWVRLLKLNNVAYDYVIPEVKLEKDFYYDYRKEFLKPEVEAYFKQTRELVKELNPKVIVTMGQLATDCFLTDNIKIDAGHAYVFDSIYTNAKIIPTYHPSEMYLEKIRPFWGRLALSKAQEVVNGKEEKPANYVVHNNLLKAEGFFKACRESKEVCIDIESANLTKVFGKGKHDPNTFEDWESLITGIGFSYQPDEAIAFTKADMSTSDWKQVIQFTKEIMENPSIEKIGQNFMYDCAVLWKIYGITIKGPVWDTMFAGNVIYCELPSSLGDQGRLWTYGPTWKGGWHETGEKLRLYCAQDVVNQHRLKYHQIKKLKSINMYDYFVKLHPPLFEHIFETAMRGIKVDTKLRDEMAEKATQYMQPLIDEVKEWAKPYTPPAVTKKRKRDNPKDEIVTSLGEFDPKISAKDFKAKLLYKGIPEKMAKDYYVAKAKDEKAFGHTPGFVYKKAYKVEEVYAKQNFNPKSSKQCVEVLKNAGCKVRKVTRKDGTVSSSTDRLSLLKILDKNKESDEVLGFITNLLILKEGFKLVTSYLTNRIEKDGRWRYHYNPEGTETGRSATKKTQWLTCGNSQNVPRSAFQGIKFKNVFIPDEGYTLVQCDQAAAEARLVAYLADCERLVKIMESGEDPHLHTLAAMYDRDYKELEAIKKDKNHPEHKDILLKRQGIKPIAHGANYNAGPGSVADSFLKEGKKVTRNEAKEKLEAYHKLYPEIRSNYHANIMKQIKEHRSLTTPFGRKRVFMGKIDHATFRTGFAHIPQSMVPHITNLMWLWVVNSDWVKDDKVQVLQMGHDALLMQVKDNYVKPFLKEFIAHGDTIKFSIGRYKDRSIPWDAEVGKRWGQLEEIDINND